MDNRKFNVTAVIRSTMPGVSPDQPPVAMNYGRDLSLAEATRAMLSALLTQDAGFTEVLAVQIDLVPATPAS